MGRLKGLVDCTRLKGLELGWSSVESGLRRAGTLGFISDYEWLLLDPIFSPPGDEILLDFALEFLIMQGRIGVLLCFRRLRYLDSLP